MVFQLFVKIYFIQSYIIVIPVGFVDGGLQSTVDEMSSGVVSCLPFIRSVLQNQLLQSAKILNEVDILIYQWFYDWSCFEFLVCLFASSATIICLAISSCPRSTGLALSKSRPYA